MRKRLPYLKSLSWAFLFSISRIQPPEVKATISVAERNEQVIGVGISSAGEDDEPWATPRKQPEKAIGFPLPERIKVVLSNLIYDYMDSNVPMLLNMFKKRLRGYRALGYEITGGEMTNALLDKFEFVSDSLLRISFFPAHPGEGCITIYTQFYGGTACGFGRLSPSQHPLDYNRQ